MRTAQVIRRLNFSEWGGTETVVWNSSRELARRDCGVEILATSALGGAALESIDGLTIRRFKYFYPYFPLSAARKLALDKKGGNPFCFGMERRLKSGGYELIHCHNLGRLAELSARAAEKCGVPLVLSLHGGCADVPEAERMELVRPLRHTVPYGGVVERLLRLRRDPLLAASGIVCVGANEVAALTKRYPDKLVRHIPNGVDVEKFRRPAAEFDWRRKLGISQTATLLLNVSRIDYQKNQKQLVRLTAELTRRGEDVHLLLIGPVSAGWYGRELERLAVELGVRGRVTLAGGMRPDDGRLVAAYQQSDVFILPSQHEPFGIVVLEAWSAGLPVIASRVGGLGMLVADGETGLQFDSGDDAGLLACCAALPAKRNELIANAARLVKEKYSWSAVGGQLAAFYREVSDAGNIVCK